MIVLTQCCVRKISNVSSGPYGIKQNGFSFGQNMASTRTMYANRQRVRQNLNLSNPKVLRVFEHLLHLSSSACLVFNRHGIHASHVLSTKTNDRPC